jgi:PIN domain nuclease of toxin-antitoxin system
VVNLDTHVLVYALTGEVTDRENRVLSTNSWSISAIVFWELAKLVQLKRIDVDLDDAEVVRTLSGLHTWPLDLETCLQSTRLDIAGSDPADELIAATSVVHRVPLLTRDRRIRRSRVVPLA